VELALKVFQGQGIVENGETPPGGGAKSMATELEVRFSTGWAETRAAHAAIAVTTDDEYRILTVRQLYEMELDGLRGTKREEGGGKEYIRQVDLKGRHSSGSHEQAISRALGLLEYTRIRKLQLQLTLQTAFDKKCSGESADGAEG
jgi:hypothetical protein